MAELYLPPLSPLEGAPFPLSGGLHPPVRLNNALRAQFDDTTIRADDPSSDFQTSRTILETQSGFFNTWLREHVNSNGRPSGLYIDPRLDAREAKAMLEYMHSPFRHENMLPYLADAFFNIERSLVLQPKDRYLASEVETVEDYSHTSVAARKIACAGALSRLGRAPERALIVIHYRSPDHFLDITMNSPLMQRLSFYTRMLQTAHRFQVYGLSSDLEARICDLLYLLSCRVRDDGENTWFDARVLDEVLMLLQPLCSDQPAEDDVVYYNHSVFLARAECLDSIWKDMQRCDCWRPARAIKDLMERHGLPHDHLVSSGGQAELDEMEDEA